MSPRAQLVISALIALVNLCFFRVLSIAVLV